MMESEIDHNSNDEGHHPMGIIGYHNADGDEDSNSSMENDPAVKTIVEEFWKKEYAPNEYREYQAALLEIAKVRNLIVCLPTGSGKTYISLQLIKHYLHNAIRDSKHIVFMATTVPLVRQQAVYLRRHIYHNNSSGLKNFTGDMNVDSWSRKRWLAEINNQQILVMTPQIFHDLLYNGYVTMSQFLLLILDECHNAGKEHVFTKIMKKYRDHYRENKESSPRILGLTATIVKGGNKSIESISQEIARFEAIMCAKAITHHNYEDVLKHSTNAKLEYIPYSAVRSEERRQYEEWVMQPLEACKMQLEVFRPEDFPEDQALPSIPIEGTSFHKPTCPAKELSKGLNEILEVYKELGPYCARLAASAKRAYIESSPQTEHALLESLRRLAATAIVRFVHRIDQDFGGADVVSKIRAVSPKLKALTNLILQFQPEPNCEENLCAVVFVKTRTMTQVLSWYYKDVAEYCGSAYKFIRAAFVIGSTSGYDIRESRINAAHQLEVVNCFHNKVHNLVFATSVLEEGLDVPNCNLVVRFNEIPTYPSYVQSMGRARRRDARFCVFVEKATFAKQTAKCSDFENYNLALSQCLRENALHLEETDNNILNHSQDDEVLPPFCPGGTINSPMVTLSSAIQIIQNYCSILPSDKFAPSSPVSWWVELPRSTGKVLYKAFLKLPYNSVVRNTIEGPPMKSRALAKKAVHLEACKLLYENGGLDFHMSGKKEQFPKEVNTFLDGLDHNHKEVVSSFKWYKKRLPTFASGQGLEPYQAFDVYAIRLNAGCVPTESPYNFNRKQYCYGLILPQNAGNLETFVLEGSFGFMNVEFQKTVLVDRSEIGFTPSEFSIIKSFHKFLFTSLLDVRLDYVYQTEVQALLIVPLLKSGAEYKIVWSLMEEVASIEESQFKTRPSDEELINWKPEETYEDKVLVPCHQSDPIRPFKLLYNVLLVDEAYHINSKMPGSEKTFKEHYETVHKICFNFRTHALLKCWKSPSQLNYLSIKHRNAKWSEEELVAQECHTIHLIPALTRVFPFPASLNIQAKFIPSILHRLYRILVAHDIRMSVAKYFNWDAAMKSGCNLTSHIDSELEDGELRECESPRKRRRFNSSSDTVEAIQLNALPLFGSIQISENSGIVEFQPNDLIMTDYIHPDKLTIEDVKRSKDLRNQIMFGSDSMEIEIASDALDILELEEDDQCWETVKNLDRKTDFNVHGGPTASAIMEALTVANADDSLNMERMETMGDSFLKYAVSVQLFCDFPNADEGHLTGIRSKLISNSHLYTLGTKKGIGECLSGSIFVPLCTWLPPGFSPPNGICRIAAELDLLPGAFAGVPPHQIQDMSEEQRKTFLLTEKDNTVGYPRNSTYEYTRFTYKRIADSVEALIGAYFTNGGPDCALRFMEWIGLRSPVSNTGDSALIGTWKSPVSSRNGLPNSNNIVGQLMPLLGSLEKTIGYKFNNPMLVLEAFTHSSCTWNSVTGCYQRLEFLGDAVLDFLVTCHIFHAPRKGGQPPLNPGELTDLRSALVNNFFLGVLAVRHGLHKYLLFVSKELQDLINAFQTYQEHQNFKFSRPYCKKTVAGVTLAEDLDVAKVLGDLFESLTGAIYLDCGMSLDKTWQIIFRLLKPEIDLFSENVPLSPIRQLYEKFPNLDYKSLSSMKHGKGSHYATLVRIKIGNQIYFGSGKNKSRAKNAAAQMALESLGICK